MDQQLENIVLDMYLNKERGLYFIQKELGIIYGRNNRILIRF